MSRIARAAVLLLGLAASPAFAGMSMDEIVGRLGLRETPTAVRETPGWKKPGKIVVMVDKPERIGWLQDVAPGVNLLPANSPAQAIELAKDADAALGICTLELFQAGKHLRWVHSSSAGVERCVNAPRLQSGEVILTNSQRITGPSLAEHAIALMFALTRGTAGYARAQANSQWDADAVPAENLIEVERRTLLIVGLGGIGTEVARRANGLGMRIVATRASNQEGPDYLAYVGKPDELPKLVEEADVIISAVPLTPETAGIFNAALFARMKRKPVFINVGRGGSVVQADLIAALKKGQISGAGLDVTTPEPLPKDHPLWKAPNLIITPHVAGRSDLNRERVWVVMRENLRRYVNGDKLLSVVDAKRGY